MFIYSRRKVARNPIGYEVHDDHERKPNAKCGAAAWKAIMAFAGNHAATAAPMQGLTEISLGILLVIGLLTRPAALVAFLFLGSLWISEWGTSWIWELLVPVLASLGLAIGRAGRAWGVDASLARRSPSSLWW
jgi:uncharacterized membrane protein YphA (DoxX/SURF4 family)